MTETQTTTATIREGAINPLTGHMYTNDDVAAFRALQPDHPDPPTRFTGRGFPIRSARIPEGGNPGIPGGVPPGCYVLVERSARLELNGYDLVVWHVVLEAFASDTR